MILQLVTADENDAQGARRHPNVGAALCGRPQLLFGVQALARVRAALQPEG